MDGECLRSLPALKLFEPEGRNFLLPPTAILFLHPYLLSDLENRTQQECVMRVGGL